MQTTRGLGTDVSGSGVYPTDPSRSSEQARSEEPNQRRIQQENAATPTENRRAEERPAVGPRRPPRVSSPSTRITHLAIGTLSSPRHGLALHQLAHHRVTRRDSSKALINRNSKGSREPSVSPRAARGNAPRHRRSWRQRRDCVGRGLPRIHLERAPARRTEPSLEQPRLDAPKVKAVAATARHACDALVLRHHIAADWKAHLSAAYGTLPVLGQRVDAQDGTDVAKLRQLGIAQWKRKPDGSGGIAACAGRR